MAKKKAILIAEKPSYMNDVKNAYKTIQNQYPYDIDFTTLAGHVMTLAEPGDYNAVWKKWDMAHLPMMPEQFIYQTAKDKKDLYKSVKDKIKKGGYDLIIIATDPGREGELIAWAFLDDINVNIPIKRLWASDITETAIADALKNLREYDKALIGLKDASYKRSHLDWLIGMNFSRAYQLLTNKRTPIGRVMTPTLKIVVDRELELRNFVAKPYWELIGDFGKYKGLYYDENGNTTFLDKTKAKAMIPLFGKKGVVKSVVKKQESKYAPELHSLANLQNECNDAFGYTMSETLAIAQSLYEKKFLSYPRTDSAHLTINLSKEFKKMLKPLLDIPELQKNAQDTINDQKILDKTAKNKRYVDDKKVSDHYAITPTGVTPDLQKLTIDEVNVYMTVARRFLAIFMPPMITDKTSIITEANGHEFKSNGSILVDAGYTVLYSRKSNDTLLPDVKEGEELNISDVELVEKKTRPPSRYTDKSLGSIMENVSRLIEEDELKAVMKEKKGIGTPATRGSTLDKLVALKFMKRVKKAIYATDEGIELILSLGDFDFVSPTLTAVWESKLIEMEKANYSPTQFDSEIRSYIDDTVTKLKSVKVNRAPSPGSTPKPSLGSCPKCGKNVIEGKSYYLCENYKNPCTFIIPKKHKAGATITIASLKKLLAGKPTAKLKFDNGKKKWETSLEYSASQGLIFSSNSPSVEKSTESKIIGKCPHCQKNVKETNASFICEVHGDKCNFRMSKMLMGAKITATDMKQMLAGKETKPKTFMWKNGKSSEARLKYTTKLEFIF